MKGGYKQIASYTLEYVYWRMFEVDRWDWYLDDTAQHSHYYYYNSQFAQTYGIYYTYNLTYFTLFNPSQPALVQSGSVGPNGNANPDYYDPNVSMPGLTYVIGDRTEYTLVTSKKVTTYRPTFFIYRQDPFPPANEFVAPPGYNSGPQWFKFFYRVSSFDDASQQNILKEKKVLLNPGQALPWSPDVPGSGLWWISTPPYNFIYTTPE